MSSRLLLTQIGRLEPWIRKSSLRKTVMLRTLGTLPRSAIMILTAITVPARRRWMRSWTCLIVWKAEKMWAIYILISLLIAWGLILGAMWLGGNLEIGDE